MRPTDTKTQGATRWRKSRRQSNLLAVRIAAFAMLVAARGAAQTPQATTAGSAQQPATSPSTEQVLTTYEGQNVTAVEIAGRPQSTSDEFKLAFQQQGGQPFAKDKVDATVAALKASCGCKEVQVQVEPEADGVRVEFVLEPAVYFGIFTFPGAERFAYSRLVQVANYPVQAPYSADDVEQDRQAVAKFLQQEGYFQSEVTTELQVDAPNSVVNIAFRVKLGKASRFGAIDIVDSTPEQTAALTHSLQTFLARARGSAIRPGKAYHHSTVTKATEYLQGELEKQGRLGAKVKLAGAEYHADSNRADIHFTVDPGPKTTVTVAGAHVWKFTQKNLLPVYQGIGVDDESVEEGRQALISYFEAKGFFDVKVDAQLKKDADQQTVTYQITKDAKHKVQSVSVSGEKQLPESDLTSHLSIEKSHLFSPGKFSDKLVRTSVNNLTAVYRSEGFSAVKVTSKVSNRRGDIQVSFEVTEGPRDIVKSITIEGADTFPQKQFAPDGLKLATGQPYSQAHVQTDRTTIVAHYLQAGYLTASFRETAAVVSKADPHEVNVIYHIYEGPKVNAANVVTLGRMHTQQKLIDRDIAAIMTGKPLTESDLLIAGSRLYDHTGVFDWAEVDPKRDITTQTDEDVLVKVHEAKRNDLTYGIGFEVINRGGSVPSGTVTLPNLPPVGLPSGYVSSQATFYGPRGTIQYTRNNVGGKGDSLSFTGFAGRLDQRFAGYYIVPDFLWTQWKATTSLSAERNEENPIFSAQEEVATTQLQRTLDKAKKNSLFLRYSYSKTDITRVEIDGLVPDRDRHVLLSTVAANLTHDSRDNVLDEHKGMLDSVELNLNSTKLGSSVNFAKFNGQAAYYKQGFHKIVFANSIRIGLAPPFSGSYVPLSEEFFTGGGNSLRGFPLDSAGPQRPVYVCSAGQTTDCPKIQVPDGGKELLLLNSEARIPLPIKEGIGKGLGFVVFYDGGNVFPSVGFSNFASSYSNNVGLGLRYATPVGPIRIDLGQNLNPIPGIKATNYFISIGQAF